LTGGTGSAMKESSYRANLNDLKDLDQGLYQGLVSQGSFRVLFSTNLFALASTKELPGRRGGLLLGLHRN
jgi:ubiquitin-protein ligase E3 C